MSSTNSVNLLLVQLFYLNYMITGQEKVLDSKCGIQQASKNINQLLQFIIEVSLYTNIDAQVALCVYDITNKHSFQVLKNWVE
jgi:hypothetical protein